jgi:STE24 endopeptidase
MLSIGMKQSDRAILPLFFSIPFCILSKPLITNLSPLSFMKALRVMSTAFKGFQPEVQNNEDSPARAKKYAAIKLSFSLTETAVSFVLMLGIVLTGFSGTLERWAHGFSSSPYGALLIFLASIGVLSGVISFPLSFYSGFILERRYDLSNQSIFQWLWEQLKGLLVSLPIIVPLLIIFYFFLREYQMMWWLPVACVLFLVSVLLSRLAPVLIMPLFYKFIPLEDGSLKERIVALCNETKLSIKGIFTFNLSKTTKKANAGFTGIGKSKRIILGDTLMQNFSDDEIETVFAHELGHYVHGHIRKSIFVGTASVFLGLYLTSLLYAWSLRWFGFTSVDQLAALPILALWLGAYSLITSPISNVLSRKYEFEADRYAVAHTGKREAFISTMNKLAAMNLADKVPHPVVEFLFHSHPSIEKRIRAVENL